MEFLVVDGEFPHLGPHTFPRLLLQTLCILLLLQRLSHLHDSCGLGEGRDGGMEGGREGAREEGGREGGGRRKGGGSE